MRSLMRWLVMIPVGLVLILLALANRHAVVLSLDPFGQQAAGLSLSVPLFVVILLSMMAGVLVGGIALWIGQGRHRRAARLHKREAERLRREAETLKANVAEQTGVPVTLLGRRA